MKLLGNYEGYLHTGYVVVCTANSWKLSGNNVRDDEKCLPHSYISRNNEPAISWQLFSS